MLVNKVVLVTGTNRGIGKSIVNKFLTEGAIVYANARKKESLNDLIENNQHFKNLIPLYFDVRDCNAVKDAFILIKKNHGKIDCLINNAGVLVDTSLNMLDRNTLRDIFDVNVFSVFELISYASRMMIEKKKGSIINIASICGDEGGMRGQTAYSSSKGAVIALSKTAAKELGQFNVRVNSISPGFIDTDMFRSGPKIIQDKLIDGVYLNKTVGLPDDVADLCVFLASEKSKYINGQNIRVDGFAHI